MKERISNVLRSFVYSVGASALMALLLALVLSLYDQTHTVSLPVLPAPGTGEAPQPGKALGYGMHQGPGGGNHGI